MPSETLYFVSHSLDRQISILIHWRECFGDGFPMELGGDGRVW